ncbi:MAG: triose-phosphate isomerase [Synergistaceae bacterium]|jgi:triosephosphate isomerase|nr:triose-phosphate isomerase [Synergistaceae bacterium]
MMRRPIIAGNWKLNKTPSQTAAFIRETAPLVSGARCEIVVCPTAACLFAAREATRGSNIALGAQNMFYEDAGAFTGEISPDSLLELGVSYVIVGHSERRALFGESDEIVNKKTLKAIEKRLKPIVCVGESALQRQLGVTEETVRIQTKLALAGLPARDAEDVAIAYEPIWAIGTGVNATSAEANSTIRCIRAVLGEIYTAELATKIRILYGGSMNAGNARDLLSASDIDGGLIGGASLNSSDFAKIALSV